MDAQPIRTTRKDLSWYERWQLKHLVHMKGSSMDRMLAGGEDIPIWMIKSGRRICGWATIGKPFDNIPTAFMVYVRPEHRKQGLGTLLASAVHRDTGLLSGVCWSEESQAAYRRWSAQGKVGTLYDLRSTAPNFNAKLGYAKIIFENSVAL